MCTSIYTYQYVCIRTPKILGTYTCIRIYIYIYIYMNIQMARITYRKLCTYTYTFMGAHGTSDKRQKA